MVSVLKHRTQCSDGAATAAVCQQVLCLWERICGRTTRYDLPKPPQPGLCASGMTLLRQLLCFWLYNSDGVLPCSNHGQPPVSISAELCSVRSITLPAAVGRHRLPHVLSATHIKLCAARGWTTGRFALTAHHIERLAPGGSGTPCKCFWPTPGTCCLCAVTLNHAQTPECN